MSLRPTVALVLALALPLSAARAQESIEGTWKAETVTPGVVELTPYWLDIRPRESGDLTLTVRGDSFTVELEGSYDASSRIATFEDAGGRGLYAADLTWTDGRLVGEALVRGSRLAIDAARSTETGPTDRLVVDFSRPRPQTVTREGLPEPLAARVLQEVQGMMDEEGAVGLSLAVVVDGAIADVRSFGWEDHHEDVPASEKTMYRWASIGKPVTAVAALQLAEAGALDLDEDVRTYVPSWPDKGARITSRQLLCHQGAIPHYQHLRPRTVRSYDLEHPWADALVALDMFVESDLVGEPGTLYSYSTPGYVLLGAVVEKAGEGTFPEQVAKRIAQPLGMSTMQPDYGWVEIPHRATGYHRDGDRVVRSSEDDISWKLAAGGWISTVEDLARFGIGLMGPDLLTLETQLAMWEDQRLPSGESTGYGLGVGVRKLGGFRLLQHSGGQNKTSTYLVCAPELGLAVALMCNTQGVGLRDLGNGLLGALIRAAEED